MLERYGFKAIFFVVTKNIEINRYFMTWDDLQLLQSLGHGVQSHGHTHRFLTALSQREIQYELDTSRSSLTRHLIENQITFSCPGGRVNGTVAALGLKLGYVKIFTSQPQSFCLDANERQSMVGRYMIYSGMPQKTFRKIVEGDTMYRVQQQVIYHAKEMFRRAIGDRAYQYLFSLVKE